MCGLKIEGSLYMLSNDNLIWLPCMYRQQWTFEDTVSLLWARMLLSMPAATYCINILASMDYVALFFWLDAFAIPRPLSERSVCRQTKHGELSFSEQTKKQGGRSKQPVGHPLGSSPQTHSAINDSLPQNAIIFEKDFKTILRNLCKILACPPKPVHSKARNCSMLMALVPSIFGWVGWWLREYKDT